MVQHEPTLMLIVVWALFASSLIQAVIHIITSTVLFRQQDRSNVGTMLRFREATLALKAVMRVLIDVILVVLVTWDVYPFDVWLRETIYVGMTISVILAAWYGVGFILALRDANWGEPDA